MRLYKLRSNMDEAGSPAEINNETPPNEDKVVVHGEVSVIVMDEDKAPETPAGTTGQDELQPA